MIRPCCTKPHTTIIKVGSFEAGILDFDAIMREVAASEWSDEHDLATQLLAKAREHGNYVSPATEEPYREALMREFKLRVRKGARKK